VCKDCGSPLIDKPFAYRDDNVYCGACYEKNPTICTGCNKPFAIGMKRYLFRNQQWHENCFRCTDCQTSIGKSPFIPHDNKPYCPTCYEKRFAYKCSKCTKAINNGGVKYKGVPYHTECFTCYNCNKQLVNEKFAVKEDKQVCVDCYGVLYAKKCTRCNHPITGLGNEGSKFVSFEGRHWHTNCFSCCKCGANLVSKGFLTHLDDIVCPDCDNTVPVSTK
jgi:LIM domain-containing protein 2